MSKCSICHENIAVIFTNRLENGENIMEGLCLPCALKTGVPGIKEMMQKIGVTEKNVGIYQDKLNQMMQGMDASADGEEIEGPEQFLKMLLHDGIMDGADLDDADDASEDIEDEDTDTADASEESENAVDKNSAGGMLTGDSNWQTPQPANVGGDAEHGIHNARKKDKESSRANRKHKFLDQFAENLTTKAREGRIDNLIGRETELSHMIQILNRRSKNNPALIGEPGVGKTALAEGLAVKIVKGEVPAKLLDQEVFLLDMTGMVAGTQFRGQFEARMKGVVEDCRRCGNIILVIDELHNIMGAGDADGAMNASNILKPALAKGEIRVIGSTTLDEYRRFIEKDAALERRFQKVMVEEPSPEDTLEILKGIKGYYEKHHHVTYPIATLESAVRMAGRYISDRFFPDKAIDLLDEAGSKANLGAKCLVEIERLKDKIAKLEASEADNEKEINETAEEEKKVPLYEKQMEIRTELMRQRNDLEKLQQICVPVEITEQDIAHVVEMWTGIPVVKITEAENEKLSHLEERLHERVIGQNEAVDALSRAIRRSRAGFKARKKPTSFLFVGPTGVGKTELVKALGEVMFDSDDAVIRLDMSEFMEAHTVSKLIGSPPGYVGYDDGGQLTEKIRRHPYSVILLDEIEKAHADIYNVLLQILDDGRLTDSHGRVVNFSNTIIVMTSNAGTSLRANGFGFGQDSYISMQNRVNTVLKDIFRPEFLNRIDEIIVFKELTQDEIRQIVDLMLKEVKHSLMTKDITLSLTESAKDLIATRGYDPKFGARPLRRAITHSIEDALADLWLSGILKNAKHVMVDSADSSSGTDAIQNSAEKITGAKQEKKAKGKNAVQAHVCESESATPEASDDLRQTPYLHDGLIFTWE